jgi:hypothetical protein
MDEVRIALTTSPDGLSLASEVRLLKPALLYADHVTLYSPTAALFASTVAVGEMGESGMIDLLRQVAPLIEPSAVTALDLYDEMQRKKRKTRDEMQAIMQMKRLLRESSTDWLEKVRDMLMAAGASELAPALEAGLVTIDPVVRDEGGGEDALFDAYMARLRDLLTSGHAYPLLDDATGSLVRAAVNERAWDLGDAARRRGKQVTGASQFMECLPAFPAAKMAEIIDIRDRLRSPLVRFRAAMIAMERLIDAAAHDAAFEAEVADLYLEKVAPALKEIEEAVSEDTYLRQLAGNVVGDAKTYVTGGLTLAIAMFAHVPNLVAASTGVGVGAVTAAGQAAWSHALSDRDAERRQMFFLYKLGDLLSDGPVSTGPR